MNICSYLVHIRSGPGHLESAVQQLNALPGCEATPSTEPEKEMVVLVTETPDKAGDEALRKQIESISEIECLALVFGANDSNPVPTP